MGDASPGAEDTWISNAIYINLNNRKYDADGNCIGIFNFDGTIDDRPLIISIFNNKKNN